MTWSRAIQGPALLHQRLCKGKRNRKIFTDFHIATRRQIANRLLHLHDQCACLAQKLILTRDFGQSCNRPNAGCYSEIRLFPSRFHPHDRRLAAHPALFAARELRREHQYHLEIAAHGDFGVDIKEDPTRTEVARLPRGGLTVGRSDGHANPGWDSWIRSPIVLRVRHETEANTTRACVPRLVLNRDWF